MEFWTSEQVFHVEKLKNYIEINVAKVKTHFGNVEASNSSVVGETWTTLTYWTSYDV